MKILKELVLCFSIGVITLIEFFIIGSYYDANEHSILTSLLVWTIADIIAYLSIIFIPWFGKKKVKYLDGFAFSSGFLFIMIVCLARAKTFEEYTYLSAISYLSGFISLVEVVLLVNKKTEETFLKNKIDYRYMEKMNTLPIETIKNLSMLLAEERFYLDFKLYEASNYLCLSERMTRKIIKCGVEVGILTETGNTTTKKYCLIRL